MVLNRSKTEHELASEVWRMMLDFQMAQRGRLAEVLQGLGLSPGDMKALLALGPDDPRPMGSLAQAWHCDASNVTWMVDRLEERGFVERRTLAADRRVKAVALTERGSTVKALLLERLHTPPADLLTLDRSTLEAMADALAKLPSDPGDPECRWWGGSPRRSDPTPR